MKSENTSIREILSENVIIFDFDAKFADDVLEIQTECGLSIWSKKDYLSELERTDSIFKVAQAADGKIIGFALARLLVGADAQNDSEIIKFNSSEIFNIAVRESFQHKGIGQSIFDEILCELERKNISEIWLEVRKSNANAISFYQKNSFVMQFERKNYYSNPSENACVLQRLINHRINSQT